MKRNWFFIGFLAFFAFGACGLLFMPVHTTIVQIGSQKILARVVTTEAELTKGLSGTPELPSDSGMLFVFNRSDKWAFWMKDMNYPLDILWLNDAKQIVHFESNVSPNTYPKVFQSEIPARYVLELPGGYAGRHAVTVGLPVSFAL